MTEVNFGFGFWLIAQVALLVIHYGDIVANLPWWVVWFPSLLLIGFIAIAIVGFIVLMVLAAIFS